MLDIEEKAKKMTRKEFIKYVDFEKLCPYNFGLKGLDDECDDGDSLDICHKCFNEVIEHVKFNKEAGE